MRGIYVTARRHTTPAGDGLCCTPDYVELDDLNYPTEVRCTFPRIQGVQGVLKIQDVRILVLSLH